MAKAAQVLNDEMKMLNLKRHLVTNITNDLILIAAFFGM